MILGAGVQIFAFVLLSLIAVLGALGMATTMSMFRSGIFLMASFIGVSGLFILLSADLLGLLQIMMYIGGMLVMVLFMVLLMHDPGGSMMAGMEMAPVENFFSRGLLPKEDDDKAAVVENLSQTAEDEGNEQQGHQHEGHDMSSGQDTNHEGQQEDNHGDEGGTNHDDMDGDMDMGDMSMVTPVRPYAAWLGLATGALLILLLLLRPAWPVVDALPEPDSARQVGDLLMSKYMMAFEGAGLLILVGIFGAVYVARPDRHPSAKGREVHVGQDEMPPGLEDDSLKPLGDAE